MNPNLENKLKHNWYCEIFLKFCLNCGIEDLLLKELLQYIKKIYDDKQNKKGKRFFIVFNLNGKAKFIYHVQDGKVHRNFNDNRNEKFYNIAEIFSNFNLTENHNRLRISRLFLEKEIKFNKKSLCFFYFH
jgi:hypothetical protein